MSDTLPEVISFSTEPDAAPEPETVFVFPPQEEAVVVPDVLSFLDIEREREILVQREQAMKDLLASTFLNVSASSLKPALLGWAMAGYPSLYPVLSVQVDIPSMCSDGAVRDVQAYLEYCFGIPLSSVVETISSKLVGMLVSHVYTRTSFSLCVTRL